MIYCKLYHNTVLMNTKCLRKLQEIKSKLQSSDVAFICPTGYREDPLTALFDLDQPVSHAFILKGLIE